MLFVLTLFLYILYLFITYSIVGYYSQKQKKNAIMLTIL